MKLRPLIAAASSAACLLAATVCSAQEDRQDDALGAHHRVYESPQNFALEVRISPFSPDVDSDPALHGCTPFRDIFGTGKSVMASAEFDWQALRIRHLGTIGPGVGIGTVSFNASAPNTSSGTGGGCITSNGTNSGEQTSLSIYPIWAVAVLRADALWKEVHEPIVPYAKFGYGSAFWQASNTLGTSKYNGSVGQGYSVGTMLAIGLSFNLNVFDDYAARNFDEGMGVNSTYLFAEYTYMNLNGLGLESNPLRVGGSMWTFGLDWEF
jgi:hypothetical protein